MTVTVIPCVIKKQSEQPKRLYLAQQLNHWLKIICKAAWETEMRRLYEAEWGFPQTSIIIKTNALIFLPPTTENKEGFIAKICSLFSVACSFN